MFSVWFILLGRRVRFELRATWHCLVDPREWEYQAGYNTGGGAPADWQDTGTDRQAFATNPVGTFDELDELDYSTV